MPINFAIKLVATVALEAAQMGLQASRKTYGPRISETQVTTADYGTPLPRFLGARRLAGQIVWSKDLEIVDKTTKVKGGGKQNTESALWTGGVAFADCRGGLGPIDKVLKIWLDETLAYDATGPHPISYSSTLGFDLNSVMRIYLGSEDQMPDPAYVDYCETKYGPDSAPAFRGTAMLVFDRMPLDNFGNRPPQISVLASSHTNAALPYQQVDSSAAATTQYKYAAGGTWLIHYDPEGAPIDWFDAPSRAFLGTSSGSDVFPGTVVNVDLAPDGTAWFFGQYQSGPSVFSALFTCPPLGTFSRVDVDGPWFSGPTRAFDTGAIFTGVPSDHTGYCLGGMLQADAECGCDFAEHGDGSIWGLFEPTGSSNTFTLKPLSGSSASPITVTGLVTRSFPDSPTFCHVASEAHFYVVSDGKWYTIADDTAAVPGTIKSSGTFTGADASLNLPRKFPNRTSFWSSFSEISLADGSTLRTLDPSDWLAENTDGQDFFDSVNDAIWDNGQFETHQTIRFLDRVANAGVTLAAVTDAICIEHGLTDRDTSALTQVVPGYSWTRADGKSKLEPVLDIHDVDARPHDFTIEFRPRGSAPSGATILTQDFAKAGDDSARYKDTIVQDTDLPRVLRVNFADTGFDQEENNVVSLFPAGAVDSQRDVVIDLTTYASSVDQAQQLADRYMRRQWNSKDSLALSLTAQERAIEPGDVRTLSIDGTLWTAMFDKATIVGGRTDWTVKRDESSVAAINSSTTGPVMGARDPDTIAITAPTRGFVIDAPLREDSDADARPLLYSGAGSYADLAFPGAVIFEATGAGTSRAYDQLFATIHGGATWGLCNGTLAGVPSPWLWDRGNTLNVTLQSGTLTSCSEADIDADPTLNLLLVGRQGSWEYLNFTTATLNGDGSYTLSGFKRGRRGTEGATGAHAAGEAFVLAAALEADEMGLDDVGASLSFKEQSLGRALSLASAIDVAPYSGATLKPYAPARIKWSTDGTDMVGEIVRRTRIGGAWIGGTTIPLSEASEAYEVDIYHGSTFKRTIAVSGTNLFTYAGTDIAADGNTVGVAPVANAFQMSDAVGRGFALAA